MDHLDVNEWTTPVPVESCGEAVSAAAPSSTSTSAALCPVHTLVRVRDYSTWLPASRPIAASSCLDTLCDSFPDVWFIYRPATSGAAEVSARRQGRVSGHPFVGSLSRIDR